MRLLLVTDTYPPARISGALQMRDLAQALAAQGHRPLVLTPALDGVERLESEGDVQVLRVRAPRTKDVPYWRRTLAELVLPWILLRGLRRSALRDDHWDGVVWYSPTIFLGPLARAVKRQHACRGYLIVRDLFPDWAVDAGVMRKGALPYRFFKWIERFQYRQADVIGVQTPSNAALVANDAPAGTRIEVLHNWLSAPARPAPDACPPLGVLDGRINFVYAGNMGVAQDMDGFVTLAKRMRDRDDVGFVFVGRGSEAVRLKDEAKGQPNLLVMDEIDPSVLPALLAKCHVGIVALHPAHGTHNIPGKLLTYLHAGLPVLARVNPNNDLVALVEGEEVGLVVPGDNPALLHAHAIRLVDEIGLRSAMARAGIDLAARMFSPESAVDQLVRALE
ncbi:glycosyltransferase family 4 protein [uncultured Thermomonas sp.]|uniref:glycosyltransferase family 4 protein n=1 Tax=uncultured Thermomonas sp. TaxID=318121 RepID=UPI002596DCEB|nr:glycosyltransferase family 4 protein [uncultured Thermomonas sp.]